MFKEYQHVIITFYVYFSLKNTKTFLSAFTSDIYWGNTGMILPALGILLYSQDTFSL